jgi:intraflagellar transport protein 88
MTSNRGTGYTGQGAVFDPANQRGTAMSTLGPAPPLQRREDNSPEEQCNELERKVNALIDESAVLAKEGDLGQALEKAKEAGKRERMLCKQREQLGLAEQINVDLTYAVHFNLAVQFQNNGLHTEALNTYSLIVQNTQYAGSGRLRVNMGNIYYAQKKYLLAIKMYRKALDEIPSVGKELRAKINRNVGHAYVKMGQYKDAIGTYEAVMDSCPDIQTGFNLLLCYYALGEANNMKRAFSKLLTIRAPGSDEEEEETHAAAKIGQGHDDDDPLVQDDLKREVKERRALYLKYVTNAARLIAPVLDPDWRVGYDYVIEALRQYEIRDSSARLSSELEMCKALNYLKYKKYREAIEGLKAYERKDRALRDKAATNLSYLYFLEGDYDSGEKYADVSVEANQYNPKALVNKGNFHYVRGEYDKARGLYERAMKVEADNVEAIYNYGLCCKQMSLNDDAIRTFKRLQTVVDSTEVIYQIADLYHIMKDFTHSAEWFNRLHGRVPTDPHVLGRMGALFARENDESQAFHYYLEAYRYYQVNMDVISWLGAYFVKNEVYDKAMHFFERAAQIQPHEVKWQLMVASCHRRRGEYPQAKRMYEEIHRKYPENLECVRYLVHLCKDSGLIDEANEWFKVVRKLEAAAQQGGSPVRAPTSSDSGRAGGESPDESRGREDDFGSSRPGGEQGSSAARTRQPAPKEEDDDEVLLPGT